MKLIGDPIAENDFLEYCASLSWMHLTLKKNKLTFHDTFYEQFHGINGSNQILKSVHPLWNTTVESNQVDIDKLKQFLDTLAKFIYQEDLV